MVLGSLEFHLHTQHGKATGQRRHWETIAPVRYPCTYTLAFPTTWGLRNFPIEGCLGQAATQTAMQVHLFHRHIWDTVIILEEVNLPHPRCHWCDMLVHWHELNRKHLAIAQCYKGAGRKHRRLEEEDLQEST